MVEVEDRDDIHDRRIGSFVRSEMETVPFDDIEVFCNRQRPQFRVGHRITAEVDAASIAA